MRPLLWFMSLAFALLLSIPAAFAVDGTFRGKIADPPANVPVVKGWIFVEGKNQMLRRGEVGHAEKVYGDEGTASSQRHGCNSECLIKREEGRNNPQQDAPSEGRGEEG